MQRADSPEKTLMLGKIEGRRRRGWQRMRWLDGIIDSVCMNLSKLQQIAKAREAWCAAFHEVAKGQTRLSNWTTTMLSLRSLNLSSFLLVLSSFSCPTEVIFTILFTYSSLFALLSHFYCYWFPLVNFFIPVIAHLCSLYLLAQGRGAW